MIHCLETTENAFTQFAKWIKEKLVSECKVTDLNDEELTKEIQNKIMNLIDCIIEKDNI